MSSGRLRVPLSTFSTLGAVSPIDARHLPGAWGLRKAGCSSTR